MTSTTRNGNFGGLAGGDLTCTNLAVAAGLVGKWAAWLSVQNGPHAANRITGVGPWSLVTGEVVATTKAQLVSGTLAHAIDHDEKGERRRRRPRVDGNRHRPASTRRTTATSGRNGANGRVGDGSSTTGTWTSAGVDGCGQLRRLYCFEL